MNKFKKYLLMLAFIFAGLCTQSVFADPPTDAPPPPPGGGHGGSGNMGGAPIDGGVMILLVLGAGYGAWKLYKLRKAQHEESISE